MTSASPTASDRSSQSIKPAAVLNECCAHAIAGHIMHNFDTQASAWGYAALGGEVEVPTLTGNTQIKIPHGTQPGTIFRLKGKVTVTAIRKISNDGKRMTIDSRGSKPDGTKFRNLLIYSRVEGKLE